MLIFFVAMMSADCRVTLYGAYATPQAACEAVKRCEQFDLPWQYDAYIARAAGEYATTGGRHPGDFGPSEWLNWTPNFCLAEQAVVGEDDAVTVINCADLR